MGPIPPLALAALLVAQGGGEARRNVVLTGMTATPIGAGTCFDPIEDYPVRARRNEEGGTVVARLFVTGVGRVAGCLILQGPGFASLEAATCQILRARARFAAFGGGGLAVFDYRIFWDLSRLPPIRRPGLTTYRD